MNQLDFFILILLVCVGLANNPSNGNGLLEFSHLKVASCMEDCLQCRNGPNSCTKCSEGADCCNWACLECENQITCKNCVEGFRLDEKLNICVSEDSCDIFCKLCDDNQICIQCFEEYFFNKEMLVCQQCAPKCYQCESLDNCTICVSKTYLENGFCLDCQQHCQECINATNCVLCKQSYYIDSVGKCEKCMDYCVKCTQGDNCQECQPKFYYDADEKKCLPCPGACSKCRNSNQCLSCEQGYYYNKTLKMCQTCEQFYPHCTDCHDSNSLQTVNALSDTICMNCQNEYYVSKNKCLKCSQHCWQCQSKNKCISCLQRYFVNDSGLCQECKILFCVLCEKENQCRICQSGFYWNGDVSKFRCLNCPYGCKQCTQYSCRTCANGLYLKNGNCYRCDPGCFSCYYQAQKCQICMPGYFKVELLQGRCIKCAQPCLQCRNITHCTKCIYGYYLDNGVCKNCEIEGCDQCKLIQEMSNKIGNFNQSKQLQYKLSTRECIRCSIGYLLSQGTCKKCIDYCQRCYDLQNCIECFRGYSLNKQSTKCIKCPQNSKACSVYPFNQSQIKILQCEQGYTLIQEESRCVPCIKNCKFCPQHNPHQFCIDCFEGYYHFQHLNDSIQQCRPCKTPCKTCSSQIECSTCVTGYYMNEKDECIKCGQGCQQCKSHACFVCAEGYRLDVVSLKCDKCKVDNCLSCKSLLQKCDTCDNGYEYYNASINVSTQLYSESQQPLCYRCDEQIEGCKSCSSPLLCTQCFTGFELTDVNDDKNVRNSCVLLSKQSNQVLYCVIIGVLSLLCLVLIVCIVMIRRKFPKTLNNKIVKANQKQTLFQTSQQSISPIDTVISSSPSYGKKSSIFKSFTAIN